MAGAAFLVLEVVLLLPVAVPVLLLLLVEFPTSAVRAESETKEPVTPVEFTQVLGRFELTPETNLTAAH